MKKNFEELYKAFEDRFRGSRELVKERLKVYQPLLAQVPRQAEGPCLAIDLGCGRGEWLEVLGEAGLEAVGVDTNARMAQEATDRGHKIELQDALEYLGGRPDSSVAVVSAFHMVEHVPTDYLIELLDECRRVLIDDGLLILETPNPENISVGTHTFHLDPTHKSPLPPALLEFLVGQAGFAETAILRLNGAPMIEAGPIERSVHLMFEVARDYACLARKRAAEGSEALAAFVGTATQQPPADMAQIKQWLRSADDEIVSLSDGFKATMASTAQQIQQLTDNLAAQSEMMRAGNTALTNTVAALGKQLKDIIKDRAVTARDAEIERLRQQIAEQEIASREQVGAKEASIQERDAEIARLRDRETGLAEQVEQLSSLTDAFRNSTSWRLAAPLRGMKQLYRTVLGQPRDHAFPGAPLRRPARANARLVMQHGLLWLRRRPRAAAFVQRMVRIAPPLERRLLTFARTNGGLVTIETGWTLEPDPAVLQAWSKRLSSGKST
ncbi:MAG: methyltransferase domain-containing protein [Mesorhizobium sp.]|uniref:methyltransferase domain-containing protein n=1 Tax=unclassified Mesorhizobium TaxID=325217 RepID=UPI000FCB2562|nr:MULTISPECIES: methyltransferase domain-containing protein [unclassified Mesorhizobium]RWC19542.1 MAG: methyltransferase domain-containing protein [Mesorhizobium sp.]RUX51407.1 methyltransferase domain-containing protein [Mesorhizobium sp. M4A.F.Ca.ET.050.02.1.1]RVD42048.1 methyltransferase domain-containing protein [Mesorhizobium sp. M4A.F.Ca.ET.020.02.1.1]RWD04099.1 MAG: methyltransferase domain-containing protein [Mesorhizobium sp.]RWD30444.1 MAG: methyltransferase domain-containing prote